MLVSADPLCGNLSALPSAPLWLRSPPWLQSSPLCHPQSPPAKGLPSVWKPFQLHGSLPLVQVPSLFFCLCFFLFSFALPKYVGSFCLLGGMTFSASVQWAFCRSSSTCRCISTVSVGRKVISASYSSAILPILHPRALYGANLVQTLVKSQQESLFFVSLLCDMFGADKGGAVEL